MLRRAVQAELIKLRRTTAVKMAVLAPLAVVVLMLFISATSPHTVLKTGSHGDWIALTHAAFLLWGLLMLPLYITVQTSLVAGVDHADNQWKSIMARPVPRSAFYVAKLIVVSALTLFSTMLVPIGVMIGGTVLPRLQSVASFDDPMPVDVIVQESLKLAALGFLALTIQHWISLRWRSFAASTGAGVVAMVIGYVMAVASTPNGGLPAYYPWTLPMLVLAKWPVNMPAVLSISALCGCLLTALGCAEFSSREVK